jgi:DNA repair photolyase
VIPFITEPELERVREAARDAGAVSAHYVVLRLPWEVNPLFKQWLEVHFPERARRVMNRVRDMCGGKEYDSDFSKRMSGEGVWADLIRQRFVKAVQRLCMNLSSGRLAELDTSRFKRPLVVPPLKTQQFGKATGQLDLFS